MKKKLCIVLGGTKGLGRSIVHELIRAHKQVVVIGSSVKNTSATSGWLGGRIEMACDLSADRESSVGVVNLLHELEAVLAADFEIEMFFWVAGFSTRGHFSNLDIDTITRMVDTNFRNPLTVAHWAWKKMLPLPSQSHFVVVSSTTGISTTPKYDEAVYAATKSAQVSLARALGTDPTERSVKVALFCPGGMQTPFWEKTPINRETFASFLDPNAVASKILNEVQWQTALYSETVIPRGSLTATQK
jgi:short-subunit dehydrogenase